ncbi:MAG TPA: hypothetical protein PKD09_13035 [Aggregatilinea sp.]|uniref:hypothetical protein n=1 Tax=Aggregatilinea sp. TaxID=2806333 RepID=UPI002B6ADF8F|nr:hypothetical protein [Aggregatilinea sp.]HML22571.1 hypothetical protein [Aggregatilinea sp.]
MSRPKKQLKTCAATNVAHPQSPQIIMQRLHPSLRDSFVLLPPAGTMLTHEQLEAVFGGDLRGLRDLAKLVYKPGPREPE